MRLTSKRDGRPAGIAGDVAQVRMATDVTNESGAAADTDATRPRRTTDVFDAERVAELRTALTEGRIPFDAAKLAELILRYHRGER